MIYDAPETKDETILRLQKKITVLEFDIVNHPSYARLLNENARLKKKIKSIQKLVGNHGDTEFS